MNQSLTKSSAMRIEDLSDAQEPLREREPYAFREKSRKPVGSPLAQGGIISRVLSLNLRLSRPLLAKTKAPAFEWD